ncbi:MAG: hypothetical protein RL329_2083 [Bacteroidota bacterium]|jgi:hypothetical protein
MPKIQNIPIILSENDSQRNCISLTINVLFDSFFLFHLKHRCIQLFIEPKEIFDSIEFVAKRLRGTAIEEKG